MPTQQVTCPQCHTTVTVTGNVGETVVLICPQCHLKGTATIQGSDATPARTSDGAIVVSNLTKSFNNFIAVKNASFIVRRGEIFGFLGPNGAGKTTTIKAMLDLIHADAGTITINGVDVSIHGKEAKRFVGYLPEKVAFYENLTALQNLMFYAEVKHASQEECSRLISEFGLGDTGKKRVGKFSKGMVQRLGMARALLGSPPILILDEPSGGLDPRGVVLIRDKILEMKKKGTTIFVSSHILSEVQEICDRVAIINRGVIVAQDSVEGLSSKLNLKPLIRVTVDAMSPALEAAVKALPGVHRVTIGGNVLDIICDGAMKAKIILAISTAGGNIQNIQTKEPTLEEVFMRYTEA
ncbi:MAG: ABC transporter ATP-binding protein [Candidatus Thermoplasmatota archaeon]|nr:ABC transporter ATP-binding protein [Candidatus Thermoplasmatota archaeon]